MKIAYFDCFAGASGDMILGSLMDAGLELDQLKGALAKLNLTHYDLQVKKVVKRGLISLYFQWHDIRDQSSGQPAGRSLFLLLDK